MNTQSSIAKSIGKNVEDGMKSIEKSRTPGQNSQQKKRKNETVRDPVNTMPPIVSNALKQSANGTEKTENMH